MSMLSVHYASYVYSAYAVAFLTLGLNVVLFRRLRCRVMRRLKRIKLSQTQ